MQPLKKITPPPNQKIRKNHTALKRKRKKIMQPLHKKNLAISPKLYRSFYMHRLGDPVSPL